MDIDLKIVEWFDKYHMGEDDERMAELYYSLIDEEVGELQEAIYAGDVVESYDALGDTYWVLQGAIHYSKKTNAYYIVDGYFQRARMVRKIMGEYFEPVMGEIITSNFSKDFGGKAENGKISKGKNFVRPNILKAIGKGE